MSARVWRIRARSYATVARAPCHQTFLRRHARIETRRERRAIAETNALSEISSPRLTSCATASLAFFGGASIHHPHHPHHRRRPDLARSTLDHTLRQGSACTLTGEARPHDA